ncbi:MAG: AMP-binding protein, partial [Thermoplasmata archaeon]|nr:AMP-binding protein [Thermoplasmata archaeon]
MLDPGEEYHDLATLIRGKARKNGDAEALVFGTTRLSYRALDERTDRVAAGLRRVGIRPGERVGAFLFNTPEFVELWFALAKMRAVLVPLNTGLKGEILRYEIADSAPTGLLLDRRLAPAFNAVRASLEIPHLFTTGAAGSGEVQGSEEWSTVAAEIPGASERAPSPEDPAAILYTSGTTGPPKGALIPHEKYLRTPREIGLRSRLSRGSRLFTALPLFHCNAQEMTAITALLHDLSASFDERFSASGFWESAARNRATHVSLLIAMINVLFKQPERPSDLGHGVKVALTAGTTAALWPEFERRFG